jgi:hypothetical protein
MDPKHRGHLICPYQYRICTEQPISILIPITHIHSQPFVFILIGQEKKSTAPHRGNQKEKARSSASSHVHESSGINEMIPPKYTEQTALRRNEQDGGKNIVSYQLTYRPTYTALHDSNTIKTNQGLAMQRANLRIALLSNKGNLSLSEPSSPTSLSLSFPLISLLLFAKKDKDEEITQKRDKTRICSCGDELAVVATATGHREKERRAHWALDAMKCNAMLCCVVRKLLYQHWSS